VFKSLGMSDLAVEDISDDEQATRNVSTDAPLLKFPGAEFDASMLEGETTKSTIHHNDTPCSIEKNTDQSWKTIEMCT